MAVTVVKTPQGHKIIDQAIEATVSDSGGDALITFAYHGLGTGDYIYVVSDVDAYTGFWYVTAINTNDFKISDGADGDFLPFYRVLSGGSGSGFTYYQTNEHEWSSIFLPIVYKVSNDLWPINTVDTARTVSSFQDDNGYTQMVLSGDLKTLFSPLEYVKISGATDTTLNGVWQIVEKISASEVVLDLPYDVDNSFAGATVQYYYNNYQVKVKIYAGLPATHPWEAQKPYEEVAELSLTPDDSGVVMFSVSDYIKSKVTIQNNTTLFSMPLNLDAFTAFYISTAESYDTSDNYSLSTEESEFTDDTFVGYAITGKLPFKNIYSGDYADYVYTDGSPALWLTLMDRLLAVEDKFFDISFIKNVGGSFVVVVDKYVSDYLTTTTTFDYQDNGIGVYRIVLAVDSAYDSYCVYIRPPVGPYAIDLPALNEWQTRSTTAALIDWNIGSNPDVSLTGGVSTNESSEVLYADYAFVPGNEYSITIGFNATDAGTFRIRIFNDSFVAQFTESDPLVTVGDHTLTITFTATEECTKIGVEGTVLAQNSVTFTVNTRSATETPQDVIWTEEICIDILESCEAQDGFTPTDIRLLEDGSYRLLE